MDLYVKYPLPSSPKREKRSNIFIALLFLPAIMGLLLCGEKDKKKETTQERDATNKLPVYSIFLVFEKKTRNQQAGL